MPNQSGSTPNILLALAIAQAQRALREIVIRTAAQFDLLSGEMDVLFALANAGDMRMGDVARRMSISPPNATRLVKQLEAKGLARRSRSEASNRVVLVCLTERGVSIDRACSPRLEAALHASIDAVLPEDERERLLALLNRINVAA